MTRVEEPVPRLTAGLGELAAMTGVSERTLRRWAREHGMPTCRVGGRVLVVVSDFLVWLRAHRALGEDEVDAILQRAVGDSL